MRNFHKIKLTDFQRRGISNIVAHEQGGVLGYFWEASQIYNKTILRYGDKATGDSVEAICKSGWYAYGKSRFNEGTSNATVNNIVKAVFEFGMPVLPTYIDEHDMIKGDIESCKNGSTNFEPLDRKKYVQHKTVIKNRMSSTYTFYGFPDGAKGHCDPFGYTDSKKRSKYGENFYTVGEALRLKNQIPMKVLRSKQSVVNWLKEYYGFEGDLKKNINKAVQHELHATVDGFMGEKTKDLLPQLRPGMENTLITLMEIKLYLLGYDTKGIDGVYPTGDSGTKNAVVKFQKDHGLTQDGIGGKETLYKLFNEDI